MADELGTEQQVDTSQEVTQTAAPGQEAQAPSGENPAWASLREKVDPITWETSVKPYLAEQDLNVQKQFQSRAEELKQFEWAKELTSAGHDPSQIQQAITLAQHIQENPAEVYKYLGEHLQRTGQMPTASQVEDALNDDTPVEGAPADETDLQKQLREQQERFEEYVQQQEQDRLNQEADKAVEAEVSSLKTAHPEFSPDDIQEIITKAAGLGAATGVIPPLEEVAKQYQDFLNRVRQTPTPGDAAPTLLPTGGAAPATAQKTSLGKLTNSQVEDFIAKGLSQG